MYQPDPKFREGQKVKIVREFQNPPITGLPTMKLGDTGIISQMFFGPVSNVWIYYMSQDGYYYHEDYLADAGVESNTPALAPTQRYTPTTRPIAAFGEHCQACGRFGFHGIGCPTQKKREA